MGAADVVPGVSGGTIAFITGIYEELLKSIKSVDLEALKLFFTFRLKEFWIKINANFLLAVLIGIGISVVSLSRVMTYLLEYHPIYIWSFFFGLIIASALLVAKEVKKWDVFSIISLIIGAIIAYTITVMTPAETPSSWWFIILSGAIAICAMILPGISGSFILLLMGKYKYIMTAISDFNLEIICLFALGASVGIISFSHLLTFLLKRYHNLTISLLTGFMLGSLNKVWPWKETLETYIDRHGVEKALIEGNISPFTFSEQFNTDALLIQAIIMAVFGFFLIYGIEKFASKQK